MAHESDAIRGDLLSVASLPLTPCHPSPGVLNWSDDLQAAFLTKQELFILVRSPGPVIVLFPSKWLMRESFVFRHLPVVLLWT